MKNNTHIVVNDYWHFINYRKETVDVIFGEDNYVVICPRDSSFRDYNYNKENILHYSIGRGSYDLIRPVIEITKILKKKKPKLLMSFGIQSGLITSLATMFVSINHVFTITGLGSFFSRGIPRFLLLWFFLPIITKVTNTVLVVQNNTDYTLLKKSLRKKSILYRVHGSGLKDHHSVNKLKTRGEVLKILYLGRFLKSKGVLDLLEVAKLVKGAKIQFILAGKYDNRNKDSINIDSLSRSCRNVKVLNHVENSIELIDDCDVVILPSYREGLSRALVEGLSRAKPLITTNAPGCSELVDNGINGYKFSVGNVQQMADAIEYIDNLDVFELKEFGANSRNMFLSKYTYKRVGAEYFEILKVFENNRFEV